MVYDDCNVIHIKPKLQYIKNHNTIYVHTFLNTYTRLYIFCTVYISFLDLFILLVVAFVTRCLFLRFELINSISDMLLCVPQHWSFDGVNCCCMVGCCSISKYWTYIYICAKVRGSYGSLSLIRLMRNHFGPVWSHWWKKRCALHLFLFRIPHQGRM